ncbi:MAG: hypothetical protein M1312_00755 [Patescibacteria group bacterium]|nr:hypothetical protein [Patescibacteria group bacterium]
MSKRIFILASILLALFAIPKSFATTYLEAPPGPQVIISANPGTVDSGSQSTITWNAIPNPSTNSPLVGCKGPGSGSLWTWSAAHIPFGFSKADISGSKTVTVNGDITYTVVCKDQSGKVANNSVDISTVYPFNCTSNSECNGWKISVTASFNRDQIGSHELTVPYPGSSSAEFNPKPIIQTRFYYTGTPLQNFLPWVPKIVECADWGTNIITWGDSQNTKVVYTTPGTHTYPVSCQFTTSNQTIRDAATLNVVLPTSTVSSTPTGSTYNTLHINALDLTNGVSLNNVPVTTRIGSGQTPFTANTTGEYYGNLSVSAPQIFSANGQEYNFNYWSFSDTPQTITSADASITLDSSLPSRTITANYAVAQPPTSTSTASSTTPLSKFYYCSGSSCVSGGYKNLAACVYANGTCYNDASCSTSNICGPGNKKQGPGPGSNPGGSGSTTVVTSKDISITINPANACLPRNGVTNTTNLYWNVRVTHSCPVGYSFNGTDSGTCSSSFAGGPTTAPSSGITPVSIDKTTNFSISCERPSYTCSKTYTKIITNADGSTSTEAYTDTQKINGEPAANFTTVHYVSKPTIGSFISNPQNILLNKSTVLSWISNILNQDASIPTQLYCYPSGGTGDTSGWMAGTRYLSSTSTGNLYPQKSTVYNLTCRNYDVVDTGCYNDASTSTSVNVYTPSLQETNPSALIERAVLNFFKGL